MYLILVGEKSAGTRTRVRAPASAISAEKSYAPSEPCSATSLLGIVIVMHVLAYSGMVVL